jgi:type II secretory pathway pseudopilin PulG
VQVTSLRLDERGFSLVEALTAATISVIAVMGLAYSFGVGRGLVNRYEVARAALGEAQSQLEALQLAPRNDPSMTIGYVSPPTPFLYEGATLGTSSWRVVAYDDPSLPGTVNLKRVIMTVQWTRNAQTDSVSLERLWQP